MSTITIKIIHSFAILSYDIDFDQPLLGVLHVLDPAVRRLADVPMAICEPIASGNAPLLTTLAHRPMYVFCDALNASTIVAPLSLVPLAGYGEIQ